MPVGDLHNDAWVIALDIGDRLAMHKPLPGLRYGVKANDKRKLQQRGWGFEEEVA